MTNPLEQAPKQENKKETTTLPGQGIGEIKGGTEEADNKWYNNVEEAAKAEPPKYEGERTTPANKVETKKINFNTKKMDKAIEKMIPELKSKGIAMDMNQIKLELESIHTTYSSEKFIKQISAKVNKAKLIIKVKVMDAFLKNKKGVNKKLIKDIEDKSEQLGFFLAQSIANEAETENQEKFVNFIKEGDRHIYDSPEMQDIITYITAELQKADPQKEAALQTQSEEVEKALKRMVLTDTKQFEKDIAKQKKANPNKLKRDWLILTTLLKKAENVNPTLISNVKQKLTYLDSELAGTISKPARERKTFSDQSDLPEYEHTIEKEAQKAQEAPQYDIKKELKYQTPKENKKVPSLEELANDKQIEEVEPIIDSSNMENTKVVNMKKIQEQANREANNYEAKSATINPIKEVDDFVTMLADTLAKSNSKEGKIQLNARLKASQAYLSYIKEIDRMDKNNENRSRFLGRKNYKHIKQLKNNYTNLKEAGEKIGVTLPEDIFPNL
jgi:hypothetical protein